jgi:hypothetical protein
MKGVEAEVFASQVLYLLSALSCSFGFLRGFVPTLPKDGSSQGMTNAQRLQQVGWRLAGGDLHRSQGAGARV